MSTTNTHSTTPLTTPPTTDPADGPSAGPAGFFSPDDVRAYVCRTPFITCTELQPLLGFGDRKYYELIHHGDFPLPVGLADRGHYSWWSHEVADFLLALPRIPRGRRRPVPAPVVVDTSEELVAVRTRQKHERRPQPAPRVDPPVYDENNPVPVVATVRARKAS